MSKSNSLSGLSRSNPYDKHHEEQLIMRDHLAIDRTVLANERTFLAYCRTSLALIISGAVYLRLADTPLTGLVGGGLIILGLLVAATGTWRYISMSRRISTAARKPVDTHQKSDKSVS